MRVVGRLALGAFGKVLSGAGPVFEARASKPDARPPGGLDTLAAICRATRLPVIAIGGINDANAAEVRRAGAAGIAVISAILAAPDVQAAARRLKSRVV